MIVPIGIITTTTTIITLAIIRIFDWYGGSRICSISRAIIITGSSSRIIDGCHFSLQRRLIIVAVVVVIVVVVGSYHHWWFIPTIILYPNTMVVVDHSVIIMRQ